MSQEITRTGNSATALTPPEPCFSVPLPATRRGARQARLLAAEQLKTWGLPLDPARLITGELAANAALHGRVPGRDFRLTLTVAAPATLRIEVTDTRGDCLPGRARSVDGAPRESGYGLLLVEELADRWGVHSGPVPSKTVWAELDLLLDSVARATTSDQREQIAATAARLCLAVLPEVPDRGTQDPRVSLLAPHVIALLRRTVNWEVDRSTVQAAAACALRLVTAVHRTGDYASAFSLGRDAVELLETRLGEDSVLLIRLRQRVGRALFRLGRFDESEALLRRVLEDCERTLGPDAPDTLMACRRLANPLLNLDQVPDGISLLRRAVEGYVRVLGPVHPLTLLARVGLLEVSTQSADVDAGPDLVTECRRTLGEDHTVTLSAELSCAVALNRAGRPEEALPRIRSAFAGLVRRFGPDYPIALNARQTLGAILYALGRKTQAVEHLKEVVEGRTRVLGPDHQWTLIAEERRNQYLAEPEV